MGLTTDCSKVAHIGVLCGGAVLSSKSVHLLRDYEELQSHALSEYSDMAHTCCEQLNMRMWYLLDRLVVLADTRE